ncbi:MAG: hypothetical protein QM708_13690 [Propioniciclava sp.]|uniref:hypothetical protein n=1 Tax=Propioniciclava sp. TaxID=2038686 RepID=UPI0039E5319C
MTMPDAPSHAHQAPPDASPRLLFVTDLNYAAAGRRYCDEDIALSGRLREHFHVALCHPRDAVAFMKDADVMLVRNTGPAAGHLDAYHAYRAQAIAWGVPVFTELTGKADQIGKQYLIDLCAAGYPVIPTIDDPAHLGRLPETGQYVVKPKQGADSVGMRFVTRAEASAVQEPDVLIQPRIDFAYEVSFYYVDHDFQYALYAPDPDRRWELQPYDPSPSDLAFAQRFIDWNTIDHGIQRVDACRTADGRLLLVELEDLNPYLSLDRTTPDRREAMLAAMVRSLTGLSGGRAPAARS